MKKLVFRFIFSCGFIILAGGFSRLWLVGVIVIVIVIVCLLAVIGSLFVLVAIGVVCLSIFFHLLNLSIGINYGFGTLCRCLRCSKHQSKKSKTYKNCFC